MIRLYLILFLAAFTIPFNGRTEEPIAPPTPTVNEHVAPPPREQEKVLVNKGIHYFKNNDFERAQGYFRKAYQVNNNFKMLYNIGQAELSFERYGLAREAFEKYLTEGASNISQERLDEVHNYLNVLKKVVGALHVHSASGCAVVVNGIHRGYTPLQTPIYLKGNVTHQITLIHRDKEIYKKLIEITAGDTLRISALAETTKAIDQQRATKPKEAAVSSPPDDVRPKDLMFIGDRPTRQQNETALRDNAETSPLTETTNTTDQQHATDTKEAVVSFPPDSSRRKPLMSAGNLRRLLQNEMATRDIALAGSVTTAAFTLAGSLLLFGEKTRGYAITNLAIAGGLFAISLTNMLLHLSYRQKVKQIRLTQDAAHASRQYVLQKSLHKNRLLTIVYTGLFGALSISAGTLLMVGGRNKNNNMLGWGWGLTSAAGFSFIVSMSHLIFLRRDRRAIQRLQLSRVTQRLVKSDSSWIRGSFPADSRGGL